MNPPPNPAAEQARAAMKQHSAEVEAHAAQQAAMPLLDPLWRCRVYVEERRGVLIWLSVDVIIDDWLNVMEMMQ